MAEPRGAVIVWGWVAVAMLIFAWMEVAGSRLAFSRMRGNLLGRQVIQLDRNA